MTINLFQDDWLIKSVLVALLFAMLLISDKLFPDVLLAHPLQSPFKEGAMLRCLKSLSLVSLFFSLKFLAGRWLLDFLCRLLLSLLLAVSLASIGLLKDGFSFVG